MSEPIKLPPDLLAVTLVREGVNKHRARDIECWMNEKMALAVEQATAELRAECDALQQIVADYPPIEAELREVSDRAFRAEAENERLRADAERWKGLFGEALDAFNSRRPTDIEWSAMRDMAREARAALKEAK